jgi:hypothetical protein
MCTSQISIVNNLFFVVLFTSSIYVTSHVGAPRISVVYNCLPHPKNLIWRELITEQLEVTMKSGLVDVAHDFHVAITAGNDDIAIGNVEEAAAMIRNISSKFEISITIGENSYEYPGFNIMWNIAKQSLEPENHLILIYHSKSMTNEPSYDKQHPRSHFNMMLTAAVVEDWRTYVEKMGMNPNYKTGGLCASLALQMYDFYWVRASYAKTLELRKETVDRFYYEHWLGAPTGNVWNENYYVCNEKYGEPRGSCDLTDCVRRIFTTMKLTQAGYYYENTPEK